MAVAGGALITVLGGLLVLVSAFVLIAIPYGPKTRSMPDIKGRF